MAQIHRTLNCRGTRIHAVEDGEGPLVVLLHGFPESWYSWRHQIPALAAAGYRVVAIDQRGYGRSSKYRVQSAYRIKELVGDVLGVIDAYGQDKAVVIGHDWGAPVAWAAALLRPDRFRGVIGLSVPFRPRGSVRPTSVMPQTSEAIFYQLYFQEPGVAEADLERNPRATIRRLLYWASGDARDPVARHVDAADVGMVPRAVGLVQSRPDPPVLPAWLGTAEIDFYAGEFARVGFRGGLNWYRNIDRNWELLAPWAGAKVTVPALYVAGDRDLVLAFRGMDQLLPTLPQFIPNLRQTIILPGCGHWTQQEQPAEVNAAMLEFLKTLG